MIYTSRPACLYMNIFLARACASGFEMRQPARALYVAASLFFFFFDTSFQTTSTYSHYTLYCMLLYPPPLMPAPARFERLMIAHVLFAVIYDIRRRCCRGARAIVECVKRVSFCAQAARRAACVRHRGVRNQKALQRANRYQPPSGPSASVQRGRCAPVQGRRCLV